MLRLVYSDDGSRFTEILTLNMLKGWNWLVLPPYTCWDIVIGPAEFSLYSLWTNRQKLIKLNDQCRRVRPKPGCQPAELKDIELDNLVKLNYCLVPIMRSGPILSERCHLSAVCSSHYCIVAKRCNRGRGLGCETSSTHDQLCMFLVHRLMVLRSMVYVTLSSYRSTALTKCGPPSGGDPFDGQKE